jgi:hypothetical protein
MCMSLKDLFFIFSKNDYEKDFKKKLASLEVKIEELKETLSAYQQQNSQEKHDNQIKSKEPPIIIEKINIEKIILDKYELNNNFGQLGIKELKGKLNIGATYGSEYTPHLDKEDEGSKEEEGSKQTERSKGPSTENGPRVNIHPKREEDMKKD